MGPAKLLLQAVCLVSLDCFMGSPGARLADLVADAGGVLGGVAFMNPEIVQQIDRVFELAKERRFGFWIFILMRVLDPERNMTLR